MFKSIYKNLKQTSNEQLVDKYIEKHILGCLDKATLIDSELKRITRFSTVIINGYEYDNIYQIIEKIKNNPDVVAGLSKYHNSGIVHGDVTVDNILVSKKLNKPVIIDPAPDGNIFEGPVFDFGKNLQSLLGGYEFIVWKKEKPKVKNNEINFNDQISLKYSLLCEHVINHLAPKYLTKEEQKAILFHAGALFIRRLKHQVIQNPNNVIALYAIGVRILNNFYDQYLPLENESRINKVVINKD